uniref:Uncharacterized protein n=1 Tax=Tanacetum cinerariifolium TaxID=118510 RepID=A0A699HVA9_TANCI|nr:hypothetical protein [Tanacetum cinerariifolium]
MDIYSILSELSTSENRLDVQLVRYAKHKDTNSNKVTSNNDYGLKVIVDVASSSGMKVVTSNPFIVLNMVEKDIEVAPHDSVNSTSEDVNVENRNDVSLDNEDNDSENDVKDNDNKTEFHDTKKTEEHEDLTEDQLDFCVAFDNSLRGQLEVKYLVPTGRVTVLAGRVLSPGRSQKIKIGQMEVTTHDNDWSKGSYNS